MSPTRSLSLHTAMALTLAMAASTPAFAQDTGATGTPDAMGDGPQGFDAHGFNLAAFDADVRDPLTVQRPGVFTQGDWFFGGVFEYAKEPLVFVLADPDTLQPTGEEQVVLDNLAVLNASFGYSVLDMLRLDVAAPLYFTSTGPDAASQGAGIGDIRLAAMFAPLQPGFDYDDVPGATYKEHGFGLGVVPFLDIPVGNDGEFLGTGGVAGGGRLALTYELTNVTFTGEVGTLFGPRIDVGNLADSDALTYGAAIGVNPTQDLGFTLEGHFESPFTVNEAAGSGAPGEALLSLRKSTKSGGHLLAGGSVGVLKGASAAEYRIFIGGGYGRVQEPPPLDTDLDGLLDPVDKCVTEPETKNAYLDEDGCPDGPSKVRVVVQQNGQPAAGAQVILTPPDAPPVAFDSTGATFEQEAWPGKTWTATATAGTCLAGRGVTNIEDNGSNMIIVELAPVLDSELAFEFQDPSGAPVQGAQVVLTADPQVCAAQGVQQGGGRASAAVGGGTHAYQVQAEGYQPASGSVTLGRGERRVINVQLTPARVQITEKAIVITEKVFFEVNKTIIKPESFDLLNEVAETIKSHPELGRIEVGGHTDSDGSDKANLKLSQGRSEAVRKYLIERGCDPAILLAKGYGEGVPLDTNATPEGKALNRRVEFILIDRKTP